MRNVVLTTDLYHQHGDPNDHWNLASMYALAYKGLLKFAGIMCDDDRAMATDGSLLHFGDPSVQSIAQMNYITGMAVPVGFGSRRPIRRKEDLEAVVLANKRISSVTMLLEILQRAQEPVDIHMCGSCKDVVIAYHYAPELFRDKCGCIYLNAGTYEAQEPMEYNVSLEPYAFSQIFQIPCKIRWSPCFSLLIPYPYPLSERANYFEIVQSEMVPAMSEAVKKYFNFMYGKVFDQNWLSYLREPLDTELLNEWVFGEGRCARNCKNGKRQMWSSPGFLLSAGKQVTMDGEIVDAGQTEQPVFGFRPVHVQVTDAGRLEWQDAESSHIEMFWNAGPEWYQAAMRKAIYTLLSMLPELE